MEEETQKTLNYAEKFIDEHYTIPWVDKMNAEARALYLSLAGIIITLDRIETKLELLEAGLRKEESVK